MKTKLDQALHGKHLVKMTVFESTKPCKNSQNSLDSKGFEFISKIIPENRNRKRKETNKRKGPGARYLAQQPIEPSKPTRGFLFLLSRASAHTEPLTARPHTHFAHIADEWTLDTLSSSSPKLARDHVAAAVTAGDGAA